MFMKFTKPILAKTGCRIFNHRIRHHCELPAIVMNNGHEMPIIGLGTYNRTKNKNDDPENAQLMADAVGCALDLGYRHIDCAPVYKNQKEIGQILDKKIKSKAIARENLFITSKLWGTSHDPENVCKACQQTLAELQLDYLDMYLMHSPMGFQYCDHSYPKKDGKLLISDIDFVDTWLAMEELVAKCMCTNIGISNFNLQQLKCLLEKCNIIPQTLQIELHPYFLQQQLTQYAKCHDICITAYAPLCSPNRFEFEKDDRLLENYKIVELAEKYKRSAAQILLRFQVQVRL